MGSHHHPCHHHHHIHATTHPLFFFFFFFCCRHSLELLVCAGYLLRRPRPPPAGAHTRATTPVALQLQAQPVTWLQAAATSPPAARTHLASVCFVASGLHATTDPAATTPIALSRTHTMIVASSSFASSFAAASMSPTSPPPSISFRHVHRRWARRQPGHMHPASGQGPQHCCRRHHLFRSLHQGAHNTISTRVIVVPSGMLGPRATTESQRVSRWSDLPPPPSHPQHCLCSNVCSCHRLHLHHHPPPSELCVVVILCLGGGGLQLLPGRSSFCRHTPLPPPGGVLGPEARAAAAS